MLYTDQAKFGTDAYVYVMSVYDKSGSVYTYSVIDEEGNVLQMQSKTKGMAGKLCTYTTDGDYYVLELRPIVCLTATRPLRLTWPTTWA